MSSLLKQATGIIEKQQPDKVDEWKKWVKDNAADGQYSIDGVRATAALIAYFEETGEKPTWEQADDLGMRDGRFGAVTKGGLTGFLWQIARLYGGYYYFGYDGKDEWPEETP